LVAEVVTSAHSSGLKIWLGFLIIFFCSREDVVVVVGLSLLDVRSNPFLVDFLSFGWGEIFESTDKGFLVPGFALGVAAIVVVWSGCVLSLSLGTAIVGFLLGVEFRVSGGMSSLVTFEAKAFLHMFSMFLVRHATDFHWFTHVFFGCLVCWVSMIVVSPDLGSIRWGYRLVGWFVVAEIGSVFMFSEVTFDSQPWRTNLQGL
jgi:hypothetical protein